MSHGIVLCRLIKRTFALLLGNVELNEIINKLNVYIDEHSSPGLETCLDHLKNGSVSLLACQQKLKDRGKTRFADDSNNECELLKETRSNSEVSEPEIGNNNTEIQHQIRDKAQQPNDSKHNGRSSFSPNHARLQEELQIIMETDEFRKAVNDFKKVNESLAEIFKDNEKGQTEMTLKITATKVRVISEILGNLTNLTDAVENCEQHILKLHESFNVHGDVDVNSIMLINMVVFRILKDFTTKPLAMLDWPMIDGQKPEKFHPILGGLPTTIGRPDPFTYISDINENKVQIDSCIAAINCSGDIFAKEKETTDIVRITPNYSKWYNFNDDSDSKIISIAIDCADCEASTESQFGETSAQSSAASPSMSTIVCHGKMYILARGIFHGNVRYFLYVIDMNGKKEREEELGFLERSATKYPKIKIFCIDEKKVLILDVTRHVIHICDSKGMEMNTIDATAYLTNINASRPPIFTHDSEMICLGTKFNFLSKINAYKIVIDDEGSDLEKNKEIKIKRAVQAVAFNQKMREIIILCYTLSLEYHLATYTIEDGKLIQDIELHNGKYWEAGLISNPHGPVALLDDFKLLRLK